MVHTLPDYSSKWKANTIFSIPDMGELAARMGSIVTHDRRGNVICLDDFEGATLLWNTAFVGVGADAAVVVDWPKSGDHSCKLTAGAGAGGSASIQKYYGCPVTGNMGMEISFTVHADTKTMIFHFTYYDGTNYNLGYIQYQHSLSRLILQDQDLNIQVLIDPIHLEDTYKTYHTFKMVINTDTLMYTRMIIDDTEIDISAYGLYSFASAVEASLYTLIRHVSDNAAVRDVWIDNFILTQNED